MFRVHCVEFSTGKTGKEQKLNRLTFVAIKHEHSADRLALQI